MNHLSRKILTTILQQQQLSSLNVYKNYVQELCTDRAYKDRALNMLRELKKRDLSSKPDIGQLKKTLKSKQKHFFEKYKKQYFMMDLFPENRSRFKIKYEDIRESSKHVS